MGDKIVSSDLVPAIEGMLLKPVNDKKAMLALTVAATGLSAEAIKKRRSEKKSSVKGDW